MEQRKQYLVVMDVPGIKKYVFGTNRLVEIRGASGLLKRLNENETRSYLNRTLGENNFDEVFFGGGGGQFIAATEKGKLETCMKGLQKFFYDASKGDMLLLYGISNYSEATYKESLANAHMDLKRKKDEESLVSNTILHTGFIRECESCAGMASEYSDYAGEERLLCQVCAKKVKEGKEKGLWKDFADFLAMKGMRIHDGMMPVTFEEIGERCEKKRGYTALVYADGNAMGKLVKAIDSKERFRLFSKTVEYAITTACHESLHKNCPLSDKKIPAAILLLGGDDLLVYLTAETAFPFAIDVSRRFTKITRKEFESDPFFADKLKGKGLTISLGIAYGKSHTPFSIMFGQAEELLKSAKKAGSEDKREKHTAYYSPSFIDYHIASQFNQIRVSDSRVHYLQLEKPSPAKLYQKPYSLENAEILLDHARCLLLAGIPGTRLKRLGYAPFSGKMNGTLECLKLYTRSKKGEQRLAIRNALEQFGCWANMPWREAEKTDENSEDKLSVSTMLTDLIELTEFCNIRQLNRGDDYASSS